MGDPVTTSLLIGQIGGPLLQGMFAPSNQERQSFEGTDVSPLAMMRQGNQFTNNIGKALSDRIAGGVNLPSAYVQQPGAYTGGGMPMPIGVVASDPALKNPSLLRREGLAEFADLFGGDGFGPGQIGVPDGPDNYTPPNSGTLPEDGGMPDFEPQRPENPNGTTDGYEPTPRNSAEKRSGPRRRSDVNDGEYGQLVRAADLGADAGGDDLSQAMGSVELLLEAFGGRR